MSGGAPEDLDSRRAETLGAISSAADIGTLEDWRVRAIGKSGWLTDKLKELGKLAAEPEAYTYLPSSVKRFPAPDGLAAVMAAAGLTRIRWILTAGGIIALYVGEVP